MTTLIIIIISIITYIIIRALSHISNDSTNNAYNICQDEPAYPETTRAKIREIAVRYHASRVTYGSTFVGDDGCTYLNCSVHVDDSKALGFTNAMEYELGDSIDNMDITFNNNTMNNNQQQPPQIIIVNHNNGTINGDYHNHHNDHNDHNAQPSDNTEYADYEEVTDDEPLTVKDGTDAQDLCAQLKTKKAMTIWKKLQDEGWVDDNCRPVGLTGWQEVLLAAAIAKHVGIRNKWQVFEHFWHMSFMKQTFQKAVSNTDAAVFYKKLEELGL